MDEVKKRGRKKGSLRGVKKRRQIGLSEDAWAWLDAQEERASLVIEGLIKNKLAKQ